MLLMSPKGERDREFFLRNLMKKIDIGIQSVCIYVSHIQVSKSSATGKG